MLKNLRNYAFFKIILDIYKQRNDPNAYIRFLLFNYMQNPRDWRRKCILHKTCASFLSRNFVSNTLSPINIQRVSLEIGTETYVGFHANSPLILIDIN
jgi:hypothetical protein